MVCQKSPQGRGFRRIKRLGRRTPGISEEALEGIRPHGSGLLSQVAEAFGNGLMRAHMHALFPLSSETFAAYQAVSC